MQEAYHCLLVDALRAMIPAQLRGGRIHEKRERIVFLSDPEADFVSKSHIQKDVVDLLKKTGQPMSVGDIRAFLPNAGPAITKWIIEGAQKAIRDHFNLTLPVCVQEAINKYRADNDWLTHFLEECCVVDESAMAKSGEVWDCYKAYCARMGDFTRSTTEFYTALENKGFARIRRKNGRFVSGLTLNDATADFG